MELDFTGDDEINIEMEKCEDNKANEVVPPDHITTIEKSKSKVTKRISIYEKNMQTRLPKLVNIPGKIETINLEMIDDERYQKIVDEFCENAKSYGIISMMIFLELKSLETTKIPFTIVAFSTPLMTIAMDVRRIIAKKKGIVSFPGKLVDLIKNESIKVIIPGIDDWIYDDTTDYFTQLIEESNLRISDPIQITDYYKKLNIIPTGKNICEHMKLINWIFQINFETHLNGSKVTMPLSPQWKMMIHKYGSLLIYAYFALEEKNKSYQQDRKFGVDRDPIYLEDILIRHNIVTNMSKDELMKFLIGKNKYPSPPLPDTMRTTKK